MIETGPRLFLDTADEAAWAKWLPTGVFYGVTTNPTILRRSGQSGSLDNLKSLARTAFGLGAREMQIQTWGADADAMIAAGHRIAAINRSIVVKVPVTLAGVRCAQELIGDGIRVTLTAVYAVQQVLTAAALHAHYAAPYFGRMGDAGKDAIAEISAMLQVLRATESHCRLLLASIRTVGEVEALAAIGVDSMTFGPDVAEAMFADPLTEPAAEAFEEDARAVGAPELAGD